MLIVEIYIYSYILEFGISPVFVFLIIVKNARHNLVHVSVDFYWIILKPHPDLFLELANLIVLIVKC